MRPLTRVEDRISIEFFLLVYFSLRRASRVLLNFPGVTCGNFQRSLETFGEFRAECALSAGVILKGFGGFLICLRRILGVL